MKYQILEKLGEGKFGSVHLGNHPKTGELVAIKVERDRIGLLKNEVTILQYLWRKGCRNVPAVYWYGIYQDCACMVMTYCEDAIMVKNTGDVVYRGDLFQDGVRILEQVHQEYVIHRDIKPDNFRLKGGRLTLIDFGLATIYVDGDKIHVENAKTEHILGTPKYISPNIHRGEEPSRRDDLISFVYMCIEVSECCKWPPILDAVPIPDRSVTDPINIRFHKNQERQLQKELTFLKGQSWYPQWGPILEYLYGLAHSTKPDYSFLERIVTTDVI
jgi:casein kinase 1